MGKYYFCVVVLCFTFASARAALAADSGASIKGESTAKEEEAPVTPSHKLKATATSYYYNMEGTTAAHGNIYNFGAATVALQLLSLSYELGNGFTAAAIGSYSDTYLETNVPLASGQTLRFKDRILGWNDTLLDVSHALYTGSSLLLFGDVGVSLPTGSIQKKNPMASIKGGNYAYNLQLGSGTYDGEAGLVGLWIQPIFQFGTHLSTYQRFHQTNANQYGLGNLYKGDGWLDFPVGLGFTPRLTGYYKVKQAIHGMDPTRGRNIYTEYYYHDQQDWNVSAALKFEHKLMGKVTLVAEAGKPLAQDCKNSDQVVISTNYYGTLGVSGTF